MDESPHNREQTAARDDRPDSAMQTGSGADDEPEMLVGDRYTGETPPDPDGDGVLNVEEAKELLGGAPAADAANREEGK